MGSLNEIILFVFIVVIWIVTKIKIKPEASFAFDLLYSFITFGLLAYTLSKWSLFNHPPVLEYIDTVKILIEVLVLILLLIILLYAVIGFLGKRYSLRIDNFNVGGINIFFDKSSDIYKKTVGTFIGSKRSLFNFNEKIDNIDQVFDAYYNTYNYIKENLELLDSKKDKKLYKMSVEMLHKLNHFLAHHQNDYRRWFDQVTKENKIYLSCDKSIVVHKTTIESVQEQYYRYDELLKDITEINLYFSQESIKKEFEIKYFDWSDEIDA